MEITSYNWPPFKFSELKVLQSESFRLLLFLTLFLTLFNFPLGYCVDSIVYIMMIFLSYFECARKHCMSQSPQWRQR